ncbi:MAG: ABC transporter permease [Lachnospiraceae bacterium]|nr:ABC transporter permease [Lachnospiraceae bacterium]
MFLNVFINRLKINLRNKEAIGWSLIFSLALGTLFYCAFNSIYENAKSTEVKVAVIESDESFANFNMTDMLKELEYEDGTKMLDITEADYDEAVKLLKASKDDENEIKGAIDLRDMEDIRLILPGEKQVESAAFRSSGGIEESVLASIVSVFRQYSAIIVETIKSNPANIENVMATFEDETNELVKSRSISGENKDPYVSYFYSLMTMMAMMAAMAGAAVVESGQANQSAAGARVDASPVSKGVYLIAGLLAAIVVQVSITLIGLCYLVYGLKINFGGDLAYVFITAVLATILGISLGFFVYQFTGISKKARENIVMTIIIGGGFLSGLMIANMKTIVEMHCPIVNRINPSAVITDAFYALNMYGVGDRYYKAMAYIVGLTIVFIVSGLIMSRRKSYASL